MTYTKLPIGTSLTPDQFVCELNKAIQSLPFFETGMFVKHDGSGYWLETNGVIDNLNVDLLSAARLKVINR